MLFEITGNFFDGAMRKEFCKSIDAQNEKMAVETIYALLGSQHRCKRRNIKVSKVSEKKGEK